MRNTIKNTIKAGALALGIATSTIGCSELESTFTRDTPDLSNFENATLVQGSVRSWSNSVRLFDLTYQLPDSTKLNVRLNDNSEDGYLKDGDEMPEQIEIIEKGTPREVAFNSHGNSGIGSTLKPLSEVPEVLRSKVVADARRIESETVDQQIPVYSLVTINDTLWYIGNKDVSFLNSTGIHGVNSGPQLPQIATTARNLSELVEEHGQLISDYGPAGHRKELKLKTDSSSYTIRLENSNEDNITKNRYGMQAGIQMLGFNGLGDELIITETDSKGDSLNYLDKTLTGSLRASWRVGKDERIVPLSDSTEIEQAKSRYPQILEVALTQALRHTAEERGAVYIVQEGDTPWNIAEAKGYQTATEIVGFIQDMQKLNPELTPTTKNDYVKVVDDRLNDGQDGLTDLLSIGQKVVMPQEGL
jgi:hypothetical protein